MVDGISDAEVGIEKVDAPKQRAKLMILRLSLKYGIRFETK